MTANTDHWSPIYAFVACIAAVTVLGGQALADDALRVVGKLVVRDDSGELAPLSGVFISQTEPEPPNERRPARKPNAESQEIKVKLSEAGFSPDTVVIWEGDKIVIHPSADIQYPCWLQNVDRKAPLPASGGGPGPHGFSFKDMVSWPSLYSVISNTSTPEKAIPGKYLWVYVQGEMNRAAVTNQEGLFELTKLYPGTYSFRLWKPDAGRFVVDEPAGLASSKSTLTTTVQETMACKDGVMDLGVIVVKRKLKKTEELSVKPLSGSNRRRTRSKLSAESP